MKRLHIPERYADAVNLVLDSRGIIFGGAVRDFLRSAEQGEETLNDIDVMIEDSENLYEDLEELGFENDPGTNRFRRDGIVIDVVEFEGDYSDAINAMPDFDVNMLAYDGDRIFNYRNPSYDISCILFNIDHKQAVTIHPSVARMAKMRRKGWKILPSESDTALIGQDDD